MVKSSKNVERIIKPKGAIPGTAPILVSKKRLIGSDSGYYFQKSNMQSNFNTQYNLGRLKRLKMFQIILTKIEDLYMWPLSKILDFFSSKEGVELILSYTSKEEMIYYKNCPNCRSTKIAPVFLDDGNPIVGFLTKFSEYYYECEKCYLVFLNPRLPDDELEVYYDKYSYVKLDTIKSLDRHFKDLKRETVSTYYNYLSVFDEVNALNPKSKALDIGGGTGDYCAFLKNKFPLFQVSLMDYRVDERVKKALKKEMSKQKIVTFLKKILLKSPTI